jgi:hypothetical protein
VSTIGDAQFLKMKKKRAVLERVLIRGVHGSVRFGLD